MCFEAKYILCWPGQKAQSSMSSEGSLLQFHQTQLKFTRPVWLHRGSQGSQRRWCESRYVQGCEGRLTVGGRGRKERRVWGVSETVWDRWMPFCRTPVTGASVRCNFMDEVKTYTRGAREQWGHFWATVSHFWAELLASVTDPDCYAPVSDMLFCYWRELISTNTSLTFFVFWNKNINSVCYKMKWYSLKLLNPQCFWCSCYTINKTLLE